jgi:diguanylate cyclase (GGDEF)-like protein/PAS domain S-box-containing protein
MQNQSISPPPFVSDRTFTMRLAATVLVVNLLVIFLAGLSLYHSRCRYEAHAAVETRNLTRVLEQYIDSSIDKIDLVLLAAADEAKNQLAVGGINGRKLNGFMKKEFERLPEVVSLRMLNAGGEFTYGAGISAIDSKSAADRSFFKRLIDNPNAGLVISTPLQSRETGKWVIVMARRVNRPDGSFAGAVSVMMPVEHLLELFNSIDVGRHGAISLRDGNLGIIARYPQTFGTGSIIGQITESREFKILLAAGRTSGTFNAVSPVDKIERKYSYRRFSRYPMYIKVGLATRYYLSEWWQEVAKMLAATICFLLITLLISKLISGNWKRRNTAIMTLRQQEAKFRTIFNSSADPIIISDYKGNIIETNDVACQRLGYSRKEMLRMTIGDIDSEKNPGISWALPESVCATGQVVHERTHITRDGRNIPVEINVRTINFEGRELLLSIIRDITERKQAEQRLAELNDCFLSFGADHEMNIDSLVALCGKQLGADCAAYSRLSEGVLRVASTWNTPADFNGESPGVGSICNDVFHGFKDQVAVIGDLQNIKYAKTDPKVSRYGIRTYAGKTVSFSGSDTGLLCAVYLDDRTPGEEDKKLLGIIASAIGVEEERTRALEALRENETTLRSITSSARDAIIMVDGNGRISFWNETSSRLFGWSEEEALGNELHEMVMPERYHESFLLGMKRFTLNGTGDAIGKTLEVQAKRCDGTEIPIEVSLSGVQLKGQWNAVGIIRDISERKRTEAELEHMAYHDALTGLPNRLLLDDRLNQAIAHAGRVGHMTAVLSFDLDNFKSVNDGLGHPVGDRLLKKVVSRLTRQLRKSDSIARMGGDEFIVVLSEIQAPEDAAHAARLLLDRFSNPFELDGQELFTSASVGIALYPIDGTTTTTLIKNADIAMYQAKKHGRNSFQFYTEEINRRAEERLLLENELRHAVTRGDFILHYQPWLDLNTGRIGGMEALIRWVHPQRGIIGPDRFIPVAEETGLIIPIGEWVLKTASRFLDELQRAGFKGLSMCINVSGKQLRSPNLIGLLGLVLAEADFDPSQLELELTESSVMENFEESRRYMDAFKMLGVRLALDDFGTGYSSLSHLKRFPLDRLKIDRSFVRDCPDNLDDVAIALAIIALAHSLKLQVTAEGVETMDQADFFSRQGCNVIQGNLIGEPMSGSELRKLLSARKRPLRRPGRLLRPV